MWQAPHPNFNEIVWAIVREIPAGKVSSYGQIASMIPPYPDSSPDAHKRLAPRWVGAAMRAVEDVRIPWQRVINGQGKISLSGDDGQRQRALLEAEGILFSPSGRVDLTQFGWQGPSDAWLDEHDLLPPDTFGTSPQQKPLF